MEHRLNIVKLTNWGPLILLASTIYIYIDFTIVHIETVKNITVRYKIFLLEQKQRIYRWQSGWLFCDGLKRYSGSEKPLAVQYIYKALSEPIYSLFPQIASDVSRYSRRYNSS